MSDDKKPSLWRRAWAWLKRQPAEWRNSALEATVITSLGLVAGLWGSLYSAEIRGAWPFHFLGPYRGLSYHALLFWALVLLAAAMFFRRQTDLDRRAREAEDNLASKAEKLEQLIRTQPPEEFLSICAKLYEQCFAIHDALRALRNQPLDPDKLKSFIRLVLWSFVILAQKFDRAPERSRYAANVMLFRQSSSLSPTDRDTLKERLRFCEPAIAIENLRGVLDLECDLSTSTDSASAIPDPALKPLALPVPKEDRLKITLAGEKQSRSRLLPGAPRAFVLGTMEFYRDTSKLPAWCRDYGDFGPGIQQEIDDYFRNHEMGSSVRSFVSLSLRNPFSGGNPSGEEPIGVLNLHRNEYGMLTTPELAGQFLKVVTPNVLTLERLLAILCSEVRRIV